MAEANHTIERRAALLADKMQRRVKTISDFITPEGARPPFTQQLSDENALRFWRAHRYDHLGAQVLAGMRASDIIELDQALAAHVEGNPWISGA